MEIFVGGLVGLATFGIYTMADRYIATRDSALIKSPSAPIYKDWMRLALGVVGSGAPILIAHFVRSGVARSALQFAGLAVLFGFGGKLIEDVGAMLLKDNDTGKRLFAGEIFAQDALAQAEKSATPATGGAGLPAGAGKPNDQHVPPPPSVFSGQPSPAAVAAVKKHHATLTALGAIAPHLEAHAYGRATPEQLAQIESVRTHHAEGLGVLAQFGEAELKAAAGLAGLTSPQPAASAPPAQKPQQKPLIAPQFGWANNGEKDAA
jgi:hypothetical protein